MAAIDLTLLDSGKAISLDEADIIRISDFTVDGVVEGMVEYLDQKDGLKKTLVIDEDRAAAALLATDLDPVTLFETGEVVLIHPARFSVLEDVVSRKDGVTTVGLVRYDAAGAVAEQFETVELTAALKLLV